MDVEFISMTVRETPDVAGVSLVKILCLLPYRPDIFPEPLRVVIEIDDSAGGGIVAAAGVRKIEFGHGFFYQLLRGKPQSQRRPLGSLM